MGISISNLGNSKARVVIPYCSGKNANAYNVKLESAIILKDGVGYDLIAKFEDEFPDGITLTYEQGKSMQYTLSPFDFSVIDNIYICVRGHFTNQDESLTIPVLDIYKRNQNEDTWMRTLSKEDKEIRAYVESLITTQI